MGVRALYDAALAQRGFRSDAAQQAGIDALERCENAWVDYKARRGSWLARRLVRPVLPRGVWLHGGVGRGKSFLMDCFFQSVPLQRKTRLHFHEFMREVHRELHDAKGTADPLQALGRRMSRRFRLVCFDEFHVADVTDAMILHRLLQSMFEHRVSLVATSNFAPDGLYPDGLHRDRVLPAIALLKERMEIVGVDAGVDYRRRTLLGVEQYHWPLDDAAERALGEAFERLREARDEEPVLQVEHRQIVSRRRAGGVVWFDFATLCGGPRSQNDYLELASRFHTVLLSGVPVMPPRLAAEARRFTWLVDVLYDRRVKLIASAAAAPESLYTEGPLAHEFPRTVSRLYEMRSAEYLTLGRRDVDTALT